MVVGEETPDEGAVSVPKKLTIGYFRQVLFVDASFQLNPNASTPILTSRCEGRDCGRGSVTVSIVANRFYEPVRQSAGRSGEYPNVRRS
jgi:hypothetical protein